MTSLDDLLRDIQEDRDLRQAAAIVGVLVQVATVAYRTPLIRQAWRAGGRSRVLAFYAGVGAVCLVKRSVAQAFEAYGTDPKTVAADARWGLARLVAG